MSSLEQDFVRLAFVESKKYSQIETALNISRQKVQELWDALSEERQRINKVKQLYNRKGYKEIPFSAFYDMYTRHQLSCCYCGISQEEIDTLFFRGKVATKRYKTRGRSLELERVLPNESYENIGNLKLACYWCNNAKSDEFNEEEFRSIGKEIGKVLKARLSE